MATCTLNALRERDMDLLVLETMLTDKNFARLFVDAVNELKDKNFEVENVELSNCDVDLGETDITAILTIDGIRYGFLIEDKIDAAAMPNQYERYVKRAEKMKAEGIFSDYFIFIFCPDKYHSGNSEAKHYTYHLSYERCLEYFKGKDDPMSKVRVQQLEQAINKSKSSDIVINANANAFFRAYAAYQKEHYPNLKLTTKLDKNGYWPQYAVPFKGSYILHKINFGYVDLQINNAAAKIETVEKIAKWLRLHGCNVEAVTISNVKSAIIRCRALPVETSKTLFTDVSENSKKDWLAAIDLLTDIATFFENVRLLSNESDKY